jgi:hypothetical protein
MKMAAIRTITSQTGMRRLRSVLTFAPGAAHIARTKRMLTEQMRMVKAAMHIERSYRQANRGI